MLTRASLWHYRHLHLLVAAGVAVAVAVLAGAVLVGASVRESLRDLALQRLGATDIAVSTTTSFSARLGAGMAVASPDTVKQTVSLVAVTGTVTHAGSGRMAAGVHIYGVDEAFWAFHDVPPVTLSGRDAALSESLAAELGAGEGDAVILRASGPSDIPLGTLQGRRDDAGVRIRVTMARALEGTRMGEFALQPGQGPVAAVFVPLSLLQRELALQDRVNTILVRHAPRDGAPDASRAPVEAVQRAWLAAAALPDHGVRIRRVPGDRVLALEGLGGFINPDVVSRVLAALTRVQRPGVPALTYVANAIRIGDRAIPYSTVTAIDVDGYNRLSVPAGPPAPGTDMLSDGDPLVRGSLQVNVGRGGVRVGRVQVTEAERPPARPDPPLREARAPAGAPTLPARPSEGPVWLNEWAAEDLDARVGDTVQLEYFVWTDEGGLETRQATLTLQGVLPMMRIGGDRTLTPDYPGITDAPDLGAWDPPFPVDLSRVRPKDEAYWDQWRAAPKAFVPLELGQRLWGSRFGNVSSIRFALRDSEAVAAAARQDISSQVLVRAVRQEALAAANGTTDFGEYFLYFSFFLVVSALLIAYLFFALGIEQRAREVGLLTAVGYAPRQVRRQFLGEGLAVLLAGVIPGIAGAVGYAALIMHGLRTWWVGAVGTTALQLHVDPVALAAGVGGAIAAALVAIWFGTAALARRSPRALLSGAGGEPVIASGSVGLAPGLALVSAAIGLVIATRAGVVGSTPGFFGAGGALLVGGLLLVRGWVRRRLLGHATSPGVSGVWSLGQSHIAWRPARTVLTVSLIAFATFVLVSVVAFERDAAGISLAREGGTGGFVLLAESAVPLMHDPNTDTGRASLGLDRDALREARFTRLRLRPGDEASCLTLYQPRNPRIVGVNPAEMEGRFSFAATAPRDTGASPWRLLDQEMPDGAVPAIVDQTTLAYVLHLQVGDAFSFAPDGVNTVTLRIVGALADSVLQSELIIGEAAFVRLFPRHEGYRVWLIEAPESRAGALSTMLEDRLADSGVDVVETRTRLASYHQVENTYLATFQALGALGLLLGTLGVGAVLARNVLERQREWGLLRAVGYEPAHLRRLVLGESAVLVLGGVTIGTIAAAVAVAPALLDRAQTLPLAALGGVLAAVVAVGLLASLAALQLATRTTVVGAIRSE